MVRGSTALLVLVLEAAGQRYPRAKLQWPAVEGPTVDGQSLHLTVEGPWSEDTVPAFGPYNVTLVLDTSTREEEEAD